MISRIEGNRIALVPVQFSDVNDMLRSVRESINELGQWFPWAVKEYSVREAQTYLQQAVTDNIAGKSNTFIIRTKIGAFLGIISLNPLPDPFNRTIPAFQVRFWVRSPEVRKGWGTEALQTLSQYALNQLGAKRVEIRIHSANRGAARVAEKCGFPLEATLRNTFRNADDTLSDTLIYAKTN